MSLIKRAFKKVLGNKEDLINRIPAEIVKYQGSVEVPDKPNWVWVQPVGRPLSQAYNKTVPPLAGLAVYVGFSTIEPELLQVLSTRSIARYGDDDFNGVGVLFHHWIHEWMASGPGGGQDVVFTDQRAWLPLRVGPGGGLLVSIYQGLVETSAGLVVVESQSLDLTANLPASLYSSCYVLVYVNIYGTISTARGTDFSWFTAPDPLSNPRKPADCLKRLAAIRMYFGQIDIVEARTNTDIIDLRELDQASNQSGGEIVIDSLSGEVVIDSVSGEVIYG